MQKYRATAFILEKDGEYIVFPSEKSACEFLGVPKCCVASYARQGRPYHGYNVIRAKSENDLYANKRLRKIWSSMRERCYYDKHPYYSTYGGRGIQVCEEWKDYLTFAKWAFRNGYEPSLTIDRIDNDKGYCPDNCRWVDMKAQQNNKRSNRIIEYNGKLFTLTQLSELTGIKKTTLKERLNMGWTVDEAINRPVRLRTKGYRPSNYNAKMEG